MGLDIKDSKILSELDLSARATFQEIGRKTGLSKETVAYRVARLERKGIIQRYNTLVNFSKIGYTGFAVYCRLGNVSPTMKEEILSFLESIPETYWIALVGGRFDIAFGLMCRSVFHFNTLHYNILNRYGQYLFDTTVAVRTELRQNNRDYLRKRLSPSFQPPYFGREPEIETLDETDSRILCILSTEARMPVLEISRILEVPASTIVSRMRGMERKGIIQGYWTYVRPQKFGMESYRLLLSLTNMDESERVRLFAYTRENPFMLLSIETVGRWNFEITLEVGGHEQLQGEITKLREAFSASIRDVDFLIMFEDDLVYDPYPLLKKERAVLLDRRIRKSAGS